MAENPYADFYEDEPSSFSNNPYANYYDDEGNSVDSLESAEVGWQESYSNPYADFYPEEDEVVEPELPAEEQPGGFKHFVGSIGRGVGSTAGSFLKGIGVEWSGADQQLYQSFKENVESGNNLYAGKKNILEPFDWLRELQFAFSKPEKRKEIVAKMEADMMSAEDSTLFKLGEKFDQTIQENTYKNEQLVSSGGVKGFIFNDIPQGIGSMLSFIVPTLLSRGATLKAAPVTQSVTPFVVGAGTGAYTNIGSEFQNALDEGASIQQAYEVTDKAKVIGSTEVIPILGWMTRADRASGGIIKNTLKKALVQGTEEALQEFGAEIANALNREAVYNPDKGVWEVVAEGGKQAAVGFTTGALLETIGSILLPGKMRMQRGGQTESASESAHNVFQEFDSTNMADKKESAELQARKQSESEGGDNLDQTLAAQKAIDSIEETEEEFSTFQRQQVALAERDAQLAKQKEEILQQQQEAEDADVENFKQTPEGRVLAKEEELLADQADIEETELAADRALKRITENGGKVLPGSKLENILNARQARLLDEQASQAKEEKAKVEQTSMENKIDELLPAQAGVDVKSRKISKNAKISTIEKKAAKLAPVEEGGVESESVEEGGMESKPVEETGIQLDKMTETESILADAVQKYNHKRKDSLVSYARMRFGRENLKDVMPAIDKVWEKHSNPTKIKKLIDDAAHEAQTSPKNKLPDPTEAQIDAGNYKKGHINLNGFNISIENPKGSVRSGVGADGSQWSQKMNNHYGYIRGTEGSDGDQIDVFVGPTLDSDRVFVVDQINQDTGNFDEHKVMMGFSRENQARASYLSNYDKGWKVGPINEMSVEEFKTWVKEGNNKKAITPALESENSSEPTFYVQKEVEKVNKAIPGVNAEFVDTFDQLPESVRNQFKTDKQSVNKLKAVYDQTNDKVYVVGSKLAKPEDVERAVLHEGVAHKGLRYVMDDNELNKMLDGVYRSAKKSDIARIEKNYGYDSTLEQDRRDAAEEYVAKLAENNNQPGVLSRIVATVRRALRKAGLAKTWTDNDIYNLLSRSRKKLARGGKRKAAGEGAKAALAYHGTPHEVDRFKMEKIGTGEGAQAYGHGIYFASKKGIAEHYKNAVSYKDIVKEFRRELPDDADFDEVTELVEDGFFDEKKSNLIRALADDDWLGFDYPAQAITHALLDDMSSMDASQELVDAINDFGNVYKTQIPDDNKLLDWDRPLSEQPDIAAKLGAKESGLHNEILTGMTGQQVYNRLSRGLTSRGVNSKKAASDYLASVGIPGLRYLDQGSRGQRDAAKQTHNYVIWDEGKIGKPEKEQVKLRYSLSDEEVGHVEKNPKDELSAGIRTKATVEEMVKMPADRSIFRKLKDSPVADSAKSAYIENTLKMISTRNIADFAHKEMKSVHDYNYLNKRLVGRESELTSQAKDVVDPWISLHRSDRESSELLTGIMHRSTLARVDPSEKFISKIDIAEEEARIEGINKAIEDGAKNPLKMREVIAAKEAAIQREEQRLSDYNRLRAIYNTLPDEAKSIYKSTRDIFREQYSTLQKSLEERVENLEVEGKTKQALRAFIEKTFESNNIQPYFPLSRYGKYWAYAKEDNELIAYSQFETKAERNQFMQEWKNAGANVDGGIDVKAGHKGEGPKVAEVDPKFTLNVVNRIKSLNKLDQNEQVNEVIDDVWQMYLRSLPEMSARKHYIHRKGVTGFTGDGLRSVADATLRNARRIAKVEYQYKIENVLRNVESEAKKVQLEDDWAMPVYAELKSRHDWHMDHTSSPVTSALTSLGFHWYLGFLRPSAGIVNLTQTAIVGFPTLSAYATGSKGSAFAELFRATKDVATLLEFSKDPFGDVKANKRFSRDDAKAIHDIEQKFSLFDKTRTHDLIGLQEAGGKQVTSKWRQLHEVSGWIFHNTEVFNRKITALAAYRLARKKGLSHEDAVYKAVQLTEDSHFDYSAQNRPAFMHKDWARVAFLFRNYSVNMYYYLSRSFHDSIKGENRQTRVEAAKRFYGTIGMTALLAGAGGLPFVWSISQAIEMLWEWFDDDEKEDMQQIKDVKTRTRDFIADILGEEAAEFVMKGALDALPSILNEKLDTGLPSPSFGQRLTLENIAFQNAPANAPIMSREWWTHYTGELAGPSIGLIQDFGDAGYEIYNGNHRGWETLTPSTISDQIKAVRMMMDGIQTRAGAQVVEKEDLNASDYAMQMIGFTPYQSAKQYEKNKAINFVNQRLEWRADHLRSSLRNAVRFGDSDDVEAMEKEIDEFNEQYPDWRINPGDVIKQQERIDRRFMDGLRVPSRRRQDTLKEAFE